MGTVLISNKRQNVLPIAVRRALGLKPGMRVEVRLEGRHARISPAASKNPVGLQEIQERLTYGGPTVSISALRVTRYKG